MDGRKKIIGRNFECGRLDRCMEEEEFWQV